jgi:hypothetical protein
MKENISKRKNQIPVKSDVAPMLFSRQNYFLMIVGIAFIVLGFVLMSGGGASDNTSFSEDIFSTRRLVVAPVMVVTGFVIEVFAILWKDKANHS